MSQLSLSLMGIIESFPIDSNVKWRFKNIFPLTNQERKILLVRQYVNDFRAQSLN